MDTLSVKKETNKLFITTTLPYCNGNMHVGAAFEFILADCINRFFKSCNFDTYLNIGLDQNGSKILAKSKELGIPVKEYINDISNTWIESCNKLGIEYDNFYQTSSDEHSEKVKKIWNILVKNNDIYQKEYTGKYCIGCESFKLDKDLKDNRCQDHPTTEIQTISENNYFFNLKKYKPNLLEWLNTNPLIPQNKTDELLSFINDYEEISVSRSKTENILGIDVPGDDTQIIYIWAEALMNYIIAADNWKGWNECTTIQLYGVDNNRFQAQIYQCFLSALNYKNTDVMFIHGTILDKEGRKMSKTVGNVVDPIEQLNKYGIDAVRYYTIAGLNTTDNSNWDEFILISQFNSEICNDYGNLVSRVLHLIDTKLSVNIVKSHLDITNYYYRTVMQLWGDLKIKDALQKTNELVKIGNKYINDEKPWSLEDPQVVLSNLYDIVETTSYLYSFVFPHKNLTQIIKDKKKVILFQKLTNEQTTLDTK